MYTCSLFVVERNRKLIMKKIKYLHVDTFVIFIHYTYQTSIKSEILKLNKLRQAEVRLFFE